MQVVMGIEIKPKVVPPASIREYMSPKSGMADLSVAEVELPVGSSTGDHKHDTDQVVYILGGEVLFVADTGEQHRLGTGDLIYIPAGVVHRHDCVGMESLRQLAIFVTPRK